MEYLRNIVTCPVSLFQQFLSFVHVKYESPAALKEKMSLAHTIMNRNSEIILGVAEILRNLLQHNKEILFNVSLPWSKVIVVHNHPLVVIPTKHTHTSTSKLGIPHLTLNDLYFFIYSVSIRLMLKLLI